MDLPQGKNTLRIGVSDESPFIIYSVQSILSTEFVQHEINAYPVDKEDLLLNLKEDAPDILITDFNFSFERYDLNGVNKIEEIHKKLPDLNIIIFTAQTSQAILNKVLQIPIKGIISKRDDRRQLIEAFRWIYSANKGVYYSEKMKHLALDTQASKTNSLLSPSENEIIRLFAMGYSLMDIAKIRKRSVSTIATQKYNAMRKLQLHSNTDLIKYVFAQELI
ncbi:response regulator transcription factor (plasmid) [Pantoea agglomerans]|uniref:response regulator transcription factor n=1 Tax=Pantoea TaxID=53335 RepID=UPI001F360295|nr:MULTISPECIES: response regulator transcription factor [Pantoea]UIL54927.1 response regulator transcription factor [Pantoea agglomerans]